MHITRVEAFHVDWGRSKSAWIRLWTDSGLYGLGEASPMAHGNASLEIISSAFTPMLIGADPLAHRVLQDRLFERERAGTVAIAWNQVVDEILGDASGVNGLRIREAANGKARVLDVHGVFIAVGHTPNTQLFEGQLDMRGGYIVVKSGLDGDATATSVPGVFAAGDVADHVYRQAVTSAGTGCMAALDADKYLESLGTR